ncbi:MAG: ribose-phosphate diphosphokinase [Thermoplasmataceae archaeon]|jgi:ribose-phosphate pyrophosphokinase|nr:ribose-phosphate diphosphokinase [Candidatus Thermoplasmatota archaeon]
MKIISSSSSRELSLKIAVELKCDLLDIERKRFPDGEMYIRILGDFRGEDIVAVGNTRNDAEIIEFLLMLNAAKENGAGRVIAVIPYFGYARQHMIYKSGEPISSMVMLKSVENFCDSLIVVEIHDLGTARFSRKGLRNVKIVKPLVDYYSDKKIDYVVSPDDGGLERARELSGFLNAKSFNIDKKRIDSRTVTMTVPDIDVAGKNIVLLDDMISTGGTIIKATNMLKERGADKVYVSAIHGIFANGSYNEISSITQDIVITDTIFGKWSKITVAREVAEAVRGVINGA